MDYNNCTHTQQQVIGLFNQLFRQPFAENYGHVRFSKISWPQFGPLEFDINKLSITETSVDIIQNYQNINVLF